MVTSLLSPFLSLFERSDLVRMSVFLSLLICVMADVSQTTTDGQAAPQIPLITVSNGVLQDLPASYHYDRYRQHHNFHQQLCPQQKYHKPYKQALYHQQQLKGDNKPLTMVSQASAFVILAALSKVAVHVYKKTTPVFLHLLVSLLTISVGGLIMYASHSNSWLLLSAKKYTLDVVAVTVISVLVLVPLMARPGVAHLSKLTCLLLLSVGFYHVFGCKISLLYCLLLNCLLFPLDPFPSLLSVFKDFRFNTVPDFIILGESLLIDTISLVLYHFMGNFGDPDGTSLKPISLRNSVECLLVVGVEGTASGLLLSGLAAIIGKVCRPSTIYLLECVVILLLAGLIYLNVQLFQLPAILGVTFCGISIKQYVEAHLSGTSFTSSRSAATLSLKVLSCVCEAVILILLLSVDAQTHSWNTAFIFFSLFLCINYTSLGGIPLVWWPSSVSTIKLGKFEQFIMYYSILRGLYTFSLVLLFSQADLPQSKMMVPSILTFVIFVVFVLSVSIKPLLSALKRSHTTKRDLMSIEKTEQHPMNHIFTGIKDVIGYFEHHVLREGFHRYNSKLERKNILMRDHDLPTPSERRLRLLQLLRKLNLRTWLQHATAYGGASSSAGSSAPSAAAAAIGAFTCAQASLAINPNSGNLPGQPRRVVAAQNSSSGTSSNSKLSSQKKSLYHRVLSNSTAECQSLKPLPSSVDQERCGGEDSGVMVDDHSEEEEGSSHLTSSSAVGACCGSTSCTGGEGTKFEDDCRVHHSLDHNAYRPRHKWSKFQKKNTATRQSNYAIFHQELCMQLEKLCSNHSSCKDEEEEAIHQLAAIECSQICTVESFSNNISINEEADEFPSNHLLVTPKQQRCDNTSSAEVSGEEGDKWEQMNIPTKEHKNADSKEETDAVGYAEDSLGFHYRPSLPEDKYFSSSPIVVAGETIAEKSLPWRCTEKISEVITEQIEEEEMLQTLAETTLPWKRQSAREPIFAALTMDVSEDEPRAAEAPSWMNNLLFQRLRESGSPYLSPEDTLTTGQGIVIRPSIFSMFPNKQSPNEEENSESAVISPALPAVTEVEAETSSLPPPWESHNGTEYEPLTSPHATNTNIGDKVCSTESMHRLQPPTHHIIIPLTPGNTNESVSDLESSAAVDRAALRSPASAPNFPTHWQMLYPNLRDRRHSTSLTEEQAYEEDCLQRVQNWLDNVEPGYDGVVDLDYLEPDAEPFFLLHGTEDDLDETYDADDECLEETVV